MIQVDSKNGQLFGKKQERLFGNKIKSIREKRFYFRPYYKNEMKKIGLIGRPSSGKTTASRAVAARLKYEGNKVELVDEYARFFVSNFGEASIADQYLITTKQLKKEKEAYSNECQFLISDSPVILGDIYGILSVDWKSHKDRMYYKEIHSIIVDEMTSYDFLFYCEPPKMSDNKTVNDGKRIHTDEPILLKIDEMINSFLKLYNISHFRLSGSLGERVEKIVSCVL